jgi:hypothetical protein
MDEISGRELADDKGSPGLDENHDHGTVRKATSVEKRIFLISMIPSVLIVLGYRLHGATVALQLVLPWILAGIVARWPHLFSLQIINLKGFPQDGPYFVGFTYLIDFLLLYWFIYAEQVDWTRMVRPTCVVGIALFLVSVTADTTMRRPRNGLGMTALFLLAMFHGYVTVRVLNILLDRSPAVVQTSSLLTKSNPNARIFDLTLAVGPWGPISNIRKVSVPRRVFRSIQPRGAVCLVLRRGALEIPWYTAQACPWNGGPVPLGALDYR